MAAAAEEIGWTANDLCCLVAARACQQLLVSVTTTDSNERGDE